MDPNARRRLLVGVSVAQLATGVAGLAVAVRRRHAYDLPVLRGRADRVARESLLMGTALSAPAPMLAVQAALTARLARRPSRPAERGLGALGATMVAGYLAERLVRRRLRPAGWERLESPLALAGIGSAAAMALLGRAWPPARRVAPRGAGADPRYPLGHGMRQDGRRDRGW